MHSPVPLCSAWIGDKPAASMIIAAVIARMTLILPS
jgi:hypothetical protein